MQLDTFVSYLSIGFIVYYFFCKGKKWENFSDFDASPAEGGVVEEQLFLTPAPPTLPKKQPHWDHNFATKSLLRDQPVHMNALVNYFPMLKPPTLIERTGSEAETVDVARAQFVPKFAKRAGV